MPCLGPARSMQLGTHIDSLVARTVERCDELLGMEGAEVFTLNTHYFSSQQRIFLKRLKAAWLGFQAGRAPRADGRNVKARTAGEPPVFAFTAPTTSVPPPAAAAFGAPAVPSAVPGFGGLFAAAPSPAAKAPTCVDVTTPPPTHASTPPGDRFGFGLGGGGGSSAPEADQVAAALAVLRQAAPGLKLASLEDLLLSQATPVDEQLNMMAACLAYYKVGWRWGWGG
jgi:hypothetical protein